MKQDKTTNGPLRFTNQESYVMGKSSLFKYNTVPIYWPLSLQFDSIRGFLSLAQKCKKNQSVFLKIIKFNLNSHFFHKK